MKYPSPTVANVFRISQLCSVRPILPPNPAPPPPLLKVRNGPNHGRGPGRRGRRDPRGSHLRGLCHPPLHHAGGRGGPRRLALPPPAAPQGGLQLQHLGRVWGGPHHQRGTATPGGFDGGFAIRAVWGVQLTLGLNWTDSCCCCFFAFCWVCVDLTLMLFLLTFCVAVVFYLALCACFSFETFLLRLRRLSPCLGALAVSVETFARLVSGLVWPCLCLFGAFVAFSLDAFLSTLWLLYLRPRCRPRCLLYGVFCVFPSKQRACYLSLNPQKDETLETEKAQYILPDGSSLNVSVISWRGLLKWMHIYKSNSPLQRCLVREE